jgi:hypothetical protein
VSAAPFVASRTKSFVASRTKQGTCFAANSERPGQPRPTGRRLTPFGHRDQAFALGQFPGSFACASDSFCLLAGFALGRFFVRLATLQLTKNALALHLLFEGPESLFDIIVTNEYLQSVSNLSAGGGDDAPFKMLMPRSIRFGRTTIVPSPIRSSRCLWQGTPRGERQQRQARISGLYAALARA